MVLLSTGLSLKIKRLSLSSRTELFPELAKILKYIYKHVSADIYIYTYIFHRCQSTGIFHIPYHYIMAEVKDKNVT